MCREKPQRGSLKKLQAHRKQRSTHCENILYQGAGEQRRRCWLDGSGGQRENDTSRHNIYKYFVKYCPGVVSLWDVGLRDNPARCAVLINKFQYFDFWSLLLFLNTQDNLKSNSVRVCVIRRLCIKTQFSVKRNIFIRLLYFCCYFTLIA